MAKASSHKGALAATSATAGVLAGVLGGWLTNHWAWGVACGFLVLLGVVSGAEALKANRESSQESEASINVSGNASLADTFIAGRDIRQTRTTTNIDHSKTNNFRVGGVAAVLAILAFGAATGGTVYVSQQPDTVAIESPQVLAAEGNHSSPQAAAAGFLGDVMLGDTPGACGYLLPDEQSTCNNAYASQAAGQRSAELVTGKAGIGDAVTSDTVALVPVIGKICFSGSCQSYSENGLPHGVSFQTAFQQAMNQNNQTSNMIACEKLGDIWYVSWPGL